MLFIPKEGSVHLQELERVFLQHHRGLFAAALAVTRNRAAAEDCVHEALVAVAALKVAPRDMAAYLYRVVRNKALHSLGHSARQVALAEDYLEPVEDGAEQALLVQQVKLHMAGLDGNEQQALMLKLFEGLTFDEIARTLEESPNTVASWYRRGLDKLKHLLGE